MELGDQVAIVTGAGRGIGQAIAEELAARGARVALLARTEKEIESVAAGINASGEGRAVAVPADVRRQDAVEAAVAFVEGKLGPVTLLVNNAGTAGPAGRDWEVDADEWWECVESAVRGAYLCARTVVPAMVERGAGRVVNIASATGIQPSPMIGATSTAKAAVIRHTENLAVGLAGTGVTAFAVHPGLVKTALLDSYRSSPQFARLLDSIPEAAYSPPQRCAGLVARIATGELDGLSGCFLDATADVDALLTGASTSKDALRLRLVQPAAR